MCYIQVKNIRLNSFYEEKKIKLCLTKQLLNMFKLWCEWGISFDRAPNNKRKEVFFTRINNSKIEKPLMCSVLL